MVTDLVITLLLREVDQGGEREDADGGARARSSAVGWAVVRGSDGVLVDAGVESVVGLVGRAADWVQFGMTPENDNREEQACFNHD